MIYRNDAGYEYSYNLRDGNLISLKKPVTASISQLFIYDRGTGKLTEVSDPEEPGLYNGFQFSNDNRFFYYSTDAGKEFSYMVCYEIGTGRREVVYQTDWDIVGEWFSRNE